MVYSGKAPKLHMNDTLEDSNAEISKTCIELCSLYKEMWRHFAWFTNSVVTLNK